MQCARCRHDVPSGANQCPKCKSWNPATGRYPNWRCGSCSYQNGQYKACYRCGTKRPFGR